MLYKSSFQQIFSRGLYSDFYCNLSILCSDSNCYYLFQGISGSFKLLPQSTGRTTNVPITLDYRSECAVTEDDDARKPTKMCESQSSAEEVISLEDLENDLKKSTNKAVLIEQQKYADENLFLR